MSPDLHPGAGVNQAAEPGDGWAHALRMDRFVSITLFVLAMLCLGGAGLLLLNEFIEYLQVGRWRVDSLLDSGYSLNLIRSRWFLASDFGALVREGLRQVPTFAALLTLGPLAWWLSNRLGGR